MKQLTIFLVFATLCTMAQQPVSCDARTAQSPLIGAFRVLNTAQMRYFQQNKRYANGNELLTFEATKKMRESQLAHPTPASVTLNEGNDPLPGYELRINISQDGQAYSIIATKKEGSCRHYGAATDDRGLIYLIEPLR